MKLTPRSMARLRTLIASWRSAGWPQTPWPVMRIAPKPRRLTSRSLPMRNWPDFAAGFSEDACFAEEVDMEAPLECNKLDARGMGIVSRRKLLKNSMTLRGADVGEGLPGF